MIQSVIVTNHLGESLEMVLANPWPTGFAITSIKGIGPSNSTINTTTLATSDGSIFNSSRVNQRNIVLNIQFVGDELIETLRQKTYKYFPIKRKINLRFITDNRDLEIDGYVEKNEPNIFSKAEASQISVICPEPNFRSAGENGKQVTEFSGSSSLFEFPWAEFYNMTRIPHGFENYSYYDEPTSRTLYTLEFGSIDQMAMHSIIYEGDTDTGVLIILHAIGDVINPSIYDISSQKTITIDTTALATLTGTGLTASDTITISTVKGNKYAKLVREGQEYNIINCLGKNVGWFQLSKGDNVFTYGATSGVDNLQLTIENQVLFEGV